MLCLDLYQGALGSQYFVRFVIFWVQCIPNGRPLPLRPHTMAHLSSRFGLRCRRDFSKTSVSSDCLRRRRSRVVLLHWPNKLQRWLNLFLHFPWGWKYPMCSSHWHLPGLSFHWHRLNDREIVRPVISHNWPGIHRKCHAYFLPSTLRWNVSVVSACGKNGDRWTSSPSS